MDGKTERVCQMIDTVDGITRGKVCPLCGWVLSGKIRSGRFAAGSRPWVGLSAVGDNVVARGIVLEGIVLAKKGELSQKNHTGGIVFGDYVQGYFSIYLSLFSVLLNIISNEISIICFNPLQNKIHGGDYHPLRHPC